MTADLRALRIDQLSVEDRLSLVQAIWDSIAVDTERAPLTDAQRREVDRRLDEHRANPQTAIPWEQVEAEVTARLRR